VSLDYPQDNCMLNDYETSISVNQETENTKPSVCNHNTLHSSTVLLFWFKTKWKWNSLFLLLLKIVWLTSNVDVLHAFCNNIPYMIQLADRW